MKFHRVFGYQSKHYHMVLNRVLKKPACSETKQNTRTVKASIIQNTLPAGCVTEIGNTTSSYNYFNLENTAGQFWKL